MIFEKIIFQSIGGLIFILIYFINGIRSNSENDETFGNV